MLLSTIALTLGLFIIPAVTSAQSQDETLFPSGMIAIPEDPHFSNYSFVVDKSKRMLYVYEGQGEKIKKLAEYPTDIGKNSGDKQKENDHRTPVGIYFLEKELTQPEIPFDLYGNLAFTTDYPNIFDRREQKTGYGIWLHAVPDSIPLTRGSRGCVVVRNDVVKILKQFVKLGQTPIVIYDQINYLSTTDYKNQRQKFLNFFESWRTAWESQDVDSYMNYYDSTFKNDQMNYKQWFRHKKKLKDLYSFIKVELGPPLILQNKDQVVIRTVQRYSSNLHSDFGEKTIHARFDSKSGFKIIREDWRPLPDPLASKNTQPKSADASPEARFPSGALNN
ncbi:MAG: L,D-transpeptidase family protein [Proteobacteria bacterium]|jgi:murein L,D-transpeptidase YafK|nr:L,D-transpeptidase family protein [Pseudomonadota bacterium]